MEADEKPDRKSELEAGLRSLRQDGGDGSHLIVSADDVYVQVALSSEDESAYVEAVSNDFLPDDLQLTDEKINRLKTLGYEAPKEDGSGSPNFHQALSVSGASDLSGIVRLVFETLETVYDISPDEELEIDVTLESKDGADGGSGGGCLGVILFLLTIAALAGSLL
jgi:hypothetical protein